MTANMRWQQAWPAVPAADVEVVVKIKDYSDDANRQLSLFVKELLSRGVHISGQDDDGKRVFRIEATT